MQKKKTLKVRNCVVDTRARVCVCVKRFGHPGRNIPMPRNKFPVVLPLKYAVRKKELREKQEVSRFYTPISNDFLAKLEKLSGRNQHRSRNN